MLSALSDATSRPVLYTLGPSHYCERARWALDRAGMDYEEKRLALGPHAARLRVFGLCDTAMPVLATVDGYVQGSDRILDLCGFPVLDPVFETRFETTIGCLTRRFIYAAAFSSPHDGGILDILLDGVADGERLAGRAAWPLLRGRLATALRARAEDLPAIVAALSEELDWIDTQLNDDGGPLAESFGRAHITAASLLSPLVWPTEGAVRKLLELASLAADTRQSWSGRPFWHWTQRTYAFHRRAS